MLQRREQRSGVLGRPRRRGPSRLMQCGGAAVMCRRGFSLLELLCAMTMLILIVMVLGTVFTQSERSWDVGTNRAELSEAGRAALDIIRRDLEYAVCSPTMTFKINPDPDNIRTYGFTNCELNVVSLQHDSADGQRAVREVCYWVRENTNAPGYELMRGHFTETILDDSGKHCYYDPEWVDLSHKGMGQGIVVENVAGFALYCAPTGGLVAARSYNSRYYTNRLPVYVDVYLELVSDRAAHQLEQVDADLRTDIVERNVKRFTTRVYLRNALGYKER